MTADALLLFDALERTTSNPTSCTGWEILTKLSQLVELEHFRPIVLERLKAAVPSSGIAGFYYTNFLSLIDPDLSHVKTAAQIALEIRPVDAERLMAFATDQWARGLVNTQSRSNFVRRMTAARIPDLMALAATTVEAAFATAFTDRAIDGMHRVALVTPMIGHTGHTPTALTLSLASELNSTGIEVKLFSPQDLQMSPLTSYLGNGNDVIIGPPDVTELRKLLPMGFDASLSLPKYSLPLRWRGLACNIAAYDPDVVLFVGFFAPWMAPLFVRRPIVAMSVHSSPPLIPADVILSADETIAGRRMTPWGTTFPPALVHFHPFRVAAKPLVSGVSRTALGVANDATLLIIVGGRLKSEMSVGWTQQLAKIMVRRPETTLILVGSSDVTSSAFEGIPPDRLRIMGPREDIGDLLACSDIYINPPRMGGGFSVAEAMAAALPVVCLSDSDGGDKVGPLAVADMAEYWAKLETYLESREIRKRDGEIMRTRFSERLDISRSGPSLIQAGYAAINLFNSRRT